MTRLWSVKGIQDHQNLQQRDHTIGPRTLPTPLIYQLPKQGKPRCPGPAVPSCQILGTQTKLEILSLIKSCGAQWLCWPAAQQWAMWNPEHALLVANVPNKDTISGLCQSSPGLVPREGDGNPYSYQRAYPEKSLLTNQNERGLSAFLSIPLLFIKKHPERWPWQSLFTGLLSCS